MENNKNIINWNGLTSDQKKDLERKLEWQAKEIVNLRRENNENTFEINKLQTYRHIVNWNLVKYQVGITNENEYYVYDHLDEDRRKKMIELDETLEEIASTMNYARGRELIENIVEEKNQKIKKLESRVEELEDEVEMEREEAEKALEVSKLERWEPKVSLFVETIKAKEDDLEKVSEKIKSLENYIAWQEYVSKKQLEELPVLPKKTNKFKLLGSKIKNKMSQVKEITKEKFNTYILQRNK